MGDLSIAGYVVWQLAVGEAVWCRYEYIEREHLLNGICSIGKVLMLGPSQAGHDWGAWRTLLVEYTILENLLIGFNVVKQT